MTSNTEKVETLTCKMLRRYKRGAHLSSMSCCRACALFQSKLQDLESVYSHFTYTVFTRIQVLTRCSYTHTSSQIWARPASTPKKSRSAPLDPQPNVRQHSVLDARHSKCGLRVFITKPLFAYRIIIHDLFCLLQLPPCIPEFPSHFRFIPYAI